MPIIETLQSDTYGTYKIEYCFELSVGLLKEIGVDRYEQLEDLIVKVSVGSGRWPRMLRPQTDTDFCFLPIASKKAPTSKRSVGGG